MLGPSCRRSSRMRPNVARAVLAALDLERAHAVRRRQHRFSHGLVLTHQADHVGDRHGVTHGATEQPV